MKLDTPNYLKIVLSLIVLFTLAACQRGGSTPDSATNRPMSASKQKKMKEREAALAKKMLDNPCSVQIWEDENFEDDNDVIVGPLESRDMKNMPGANKDDWGDEIDSLKVGSKATVTVWQDEDFKDTSATYGPGTEKTNLRGNPNFGDDIDSMKITCSQ